MANLVHIDPKNYFFFRILKLFIVLLLVIGVFGAVYIFWMHPGDIYKALGLFISVIWACIFLSYFYWAVFHYNINNGKTQDEIDRVRSAKERKIKGEDVHPDELELPTANPFRSQTFGFPPGTVRGMIAFTLLFGAIALMVVSMGMNGQIDENSFFQDHYEFFKTAFLMMIAFYFGSHSLKYLQKRWSTARPADGKNAAGTETGEEDTEEGSASELIAEDKEFVAEDKNFGNQAKLFSSHESLLSNIKTAMAASEKPKPQPSAANSGPVEKPKGLIPIIDAGHGGIVDGKYTTAPKKMYEFTDDNFVVHEGVINRQIAMKLIELLKKGNIPYHDLNVTDNSDMPLANRTTKANTLYAGNKKYYYLSIHSNTASATGKGKGSNATGFEVWTSEGQSKSDTLADIAGKWYKQLFKDIRFRQDLTDNDLDKEAAFWVLRKTNCPAFLVENLFYDNRKEAEFLTSEDGQNQIANCLFGIVKDIYTTQS